MPEERIGVYICHCGTNIANMVDVEAVAAAAQELPGVAHACAYKYMCSNPGQEMIIQDIHEHKLTRIVVASCSPRMHEATFRGALDRAGLNPYMLDMANIREQCSWVHSDKSEATNKAEALVSAAIQRVQYQEPLQKRTASMCKATLVMGGGVTGLTSALELANAGQQVYLVEQQNRLGGNVARLDLTAPHMDSAQDLLNQWVTLAMKNPMIQIFMESELTALKGFNGNFQATVKTPSSEEKLDVGSVIVCTGYKEFDASKIEKYGYGKLPNVITSFEFEAMLRKGRIEAADGKIPNNISIIHCVGSRSEQFHSYCSRVCCTTALKYAVEIKSMLPDAHVSNVYTDMETFGKGCEDFYKKCAELRTSFLMFSRNETPSISAAGPKDGCNLLVTVKERLSGEEIELPTDLVVLMVSMEPRSDAENVARLVNISRDKDGWFIESHPKLDPVATTTDGVFIAGACQFPKDIPDSVLQGRAAVARILARIARGVIPVDAIYSEVMDKLCTGCATCVKVCPYGAIEFDAEKHRSKIESAVCKACGCCAALCPSGAINVRHYTDEQIFAQIEGVL